MGVAVRYWDTQWFAHPSFCMTTFVFFCLERVFFFFFSLIPMALSLLLTLWGLIQVKFSLYHSLELLSTTLIPGNCLHQICVWMETTRIN